MQDAKVELIRPPVTVGCALGCELTVVEWTFGFSAHKDKKWKSRRSKYERKTGLVVEFSIKAKKSSTTKLKKGIGVHPIVPGCLDGLKQSLGFAPNSKPSHDFAFRICGALSCQRIIHYEFSATGISPTPSRGFPSAYPSEASASVGHHPTYAPPQCS